MTVPWPTLAGLSGEPGNLCWLGPITPQTAHLLATAASADPACEWRVIVTDAAGRATAVTRVRRPRQSGAAPSGRLMSRVTLIVPSTLLADPLPAALPGQGESRALGQILARALKAARDAINSTNVNATADGDTTAGVQ